jgi:trehalose synthase
MTNNYNKQYITWLEKRSMLYHAKLLAQKISGKKIQWQQPYAIPQTESVIKTASVWFSAYPDSMIIPSEQNILQSLADTKLWKVFEEIGINAVHTSPMKLAGGIVNKKYTATVDGRFDRIAFNIDPALGTETDYLNMVNTAARHKAIIAGDIIPGHTGKGADFQLALRNYKDYSGTYDLIEIDRKDWHLLPKVDDEWKSVNLDYDVIEKLQKRGYIPGRLQRVLFSVPGAPKKETGWDATGEIPGVDGRVRRWVYLHYFKPGQPTMNWLDPSHAAQRIISGDIVQSFYILKNKIVRLDATPFLAIEPIPNSLNAWSEGHPCSTIATNNIACLIRKLGVWSFQELNLTLDAIKTYSQNGSELFYDFITRPALQHALLTKDATFLDFMLKLMREYNINPRSLIHGMQNHDEITYELVHFIEHSKDKFNYENKILSGKNLRDKIVEQMYSIAINPEIPYTKLSGNGLCTTFTGLVAARLKITDIYNLTAKQKEIIKRGHLLMAMFNAIQPGVFIISGWDLVGALPLPLDKIEHLISDGDYRWINRGAYDLLGSNPKAAVSTSNVPKALSLYGSIPKQLKDSNSFVSQLKHILKIRKRYQIDLAEQIAVPKVNNKDAVIMIHKLPKNSAYQITALNFGDETIAEKLNLNALKLNNLIGHRVIDLLSNKKYGTVEKNGILQIELKALQGKILLIHS